MKSNVAPKDKVVFTLKLSSNDTLSLIVPQKLTYRCCRPENFVEEIYSKGILTYPIALPVY
jgi:hypothetical protein